MLDKEQIDLYESQGYIIPDYKIPSDVLNSIDRRITKLLEDKPQYIDNCPALLREDINFAKFCDAPGLLDIVSQLIGPNIALWNMSFFGKPAFRGKATPWHQDGEYWPIRPLATCTVWIALDDSTSENGCVEVIPGSHKKRTLYQHKHNPSDSLTLNEELLESEFNESDSVSLELTKGQISIHDVYLMHGSRPNVSMHTRRGITLRLMPTSSLYSRDLADEMHRNNKKKGKLNLSEHPVLLLRGEDICGENKFLNHN